MRVSGVFGLALAVVVLGWAAIRVGSPWIFFDLRSVVLVVGWSFAVGVMTFGRWEFLAGVRAIGILFGSFPAQSARAIPVLRALRRNLYAGGVLGVLIGVVQMLANLGDPSTIGPSLALALMSTFTATVLAELLCRPAVERLSRALPDA